MASKAERAFYSRAAWALFFSSMGDILPFRIHYGMAPLFRAFAAPVKSRTTERQKEEIEWNVKFSGKERSAALLPGGAERLRPLRRAGGLDLPDGVYQGVLTL